MAPSLTKHDNQVLEKIKDPEAGPGSLQLIDDTLPRDPHITEESKYQNLIQREREILQSFFTVESQRTPTATLYLECLKSLDTLIEEEPTYASARNNRAQALRRVYGSGMLVKSPQRKDVPNWEWQEIWPMGTYEPTEIEVIAAASTVLRDLETSISLLTPTTPFAAISPQAAKTLAKAHTQRGSLYQRAGLNLPCQGAGLRIEEGRRREASWGAEEFREQAQRDFVLSARFGNEDAKKMLVATNPAAKLCGAIVNEAMRKEFEGSR